MSVCVLDIIILPGCRGHRCEGQCFQKHSVHSCWLHRKAGVPDVAHGHDDRPNFTHKTQTQQTVSIELVNVLHCIIGTCRVVLGEHNSSH